MTEEWRSVAGFEGKYEVSSLGRVRSLARTIEFGGRSRRHDERILRPQIDTVGYPRVCLGTGSGQVHVRVHVLVCTAWHGTRPEGLVCRHLDGNPTNSVPSNLAWGTVSENAFDSVRHGGHPEAAKTHCPQGHEYSEENTAIHSGRRSCRTCHRASNAQYEIRKGAAA